MKHPTTLAQAIKQMETAVLHEWQRRQPAPHGLAYSVKAYCWKHPRAGFRIQELSLVSSPSNGQLSGTSGSSFMADDDGSGETLFRAERLVLNNLYFRDDAENAKAQLLASVFE